MAHVDKIFKKDRLEKNILQLIKEFSDETECCVTDIIASKERYTDSEGEVHTKISSVSVRITPMI